MFLDLLLSGGNHCLMVFGPEWSGGAGQLGHARDRGTGAGEGAGGRGLGRDGWELMKDFRDGPGCGGVCGYGGGGGCVCVPHPAAPLDCFLLTSTCSAPQRGFPESSRRAGEGAVLHRPSRRAPRRQTPEPRRGRAAPLAAPLPPRLLTCAPRLAQPATPTAAATRAQLAGRGGPSASCPAQASLQAYER